MVTVVPSCCTPQPSLAQRGQHDARVIGIEQVVQGVRPRHRAEAAARGWKYLEPGRTNAHARRPAAADRGTLSHTSESVA